MATMCGGRRRAGHVKIDIRGACPKLTRSLVGVMVVLRLRQAGNAQASSLEVT